MKNYSHQAQENLKLIALYVLIVAINTGVLCLIGHSAFENVPFSREWQGKEWQTFSNGYLYPAG